MGFRSYQGNTQSENGWPIVDIAEIVTVTVPGTTQKIEVRKGDVATVLVAWMRWYHLNVEPIDRYKPRDDWGFSWDNDVSDSNHLSGTAVDINASQYPWQMYTMPADRQAKVRQGLKLFEGTIFWGRDWSRPDEMHYQIGVNASRLAAFASKLNENYLGLYGPEFNAEDDSMSAAEVKQIQDYVKGFCGPIGSDVKDIREQLTGGRNLGEYKGWKQLDDKTVVDALADMLKRLKALEAK